MQNETTNYPRDIKDMSKAEIRAMLDNAVKSGKPLNIGLRIPVDDADAIIAMTAIQREWTAIEQEFQRHPQSMARAIYEMRDEMRRVRQALTWCVVNNGETLADHPKLLTRFRNILGIEVQTDEE